MSVRTEVHRQCSELPDTAPESPSAPEWNRGYCATKFAEQLARPQASQSAHCLKQTANLRFLRVVRRHLFWAIYLVGTGNLIAQSGPGAELQNNHLHRRAVEAAIWGMPAVNYERMLQAAMDNGAKLNQVIYLSLIHI